LTHDFDLKGKVAREAATLLYFGAEKEYKQAKARAAKTLGTHFLPSNLEIAIELDKIAEEKEGINRNQFLIQMRKEALEIMEHLNAYRPVLIGSVWRGTARRGSDIDIAVYADEPKEVINILDAKGVKISKMGWETINKHGKTLMSFHVYAETQTKHGLEIVIRNAEEAGKKRKCEIFRDEIRGLKTAELEKLLRDNPTGKFIPS
jgi:predicted nucleotidyltransferase